MPSSKTFSDSQSIQKIIRSDSLKHDIQRHVMSSLGYDCQPPRRFPYYKGLAYAMRDRLIERWLMTQRAYYDTVAKRVYYLSLEFLPGRFLMNYITNLKMTDDCEAALEEVGFTLEDLEVEELDAGLGNGGLGRLASCFMDSIATLRLPGYGYGIRYDYGIFFQDIVDGFQQERSDNWRRYGSPFEISRRRYLSEVNFYGRSESYTDNNGKRRYRWVDTDTIMAMAVDILIPGYENDNVINTRLWAAVSSREFNLSEFNQGDYIGAMESKVGSENISKVLYPSDELEQGRELRLKQQYFFVAATFREIMRRFKKKHSFFSQLPDLVAVQLNDTHPTISIPELMRLLLDEEGLGWEEAWRICVRTFAYTNHTVLPEALETWPVKLLEKVLPRHLEIIYEINERFLRDVARAFPGDTDILGRMSIIQEWPERRVRMAHLAIVGSHSVNGVAALHGRILKKRLFRDFDRFFPGKIHSITNGISPRRWLVQINPQLTKLIDSVIGPGWVTDLPKLKALAAHAEDPAFQRKWRLVKAENKKRLTRHILRETGQRVNPETIFDVQVKRMHEYKRQLLNLLHVIHLYQRLKENTDRLGSPRTVIFGGKAAPGYHQAKLIIKLINSVADVINNDNDVNQWLKVIFLPNYCVSQAEKIIPATDLSEQISTAGLEASGTGNMKFALNGALTIGTLDGANIEIMEEVGEDNIFIFGLNIDDADRLRNGTYRPSEYYERNLDLRRAVDAIATGRFSVGQPDLFAPIVRELLDAGDRYLIMADFEDYVRVQDAVGELFTHAEEWTRRSILNTAHMGKFSSDRAVLEYATKVWHIKPLPDLKDVEKAARVFPE